MASYAPAEHLSHYRHVSSSPSHPLARLLATVRTSFHRWAAARHQRRQDRIFWRLAMSDPRVMREIQAIRDHARPDDAGRRP